MAKSKRKAMIRASNERIRTDWLLMTGKPVDHCNLRGLENLYDMFHNFTIMWLQDFERLKTTWLHLTGITNLNDFDNLKRRYLMMDHWRMNSSDILILRKYSMWLSEINTPSNLETLKRDYLVLNFSQMSDDDYTRLKTNWLILTERFGIDNQENIIKGWLRNEITYFDDFRYNREKCKIEFTRFYLERGVDVNYYTNDIDTLLQTIVGDRLKLNALIVEFLLSYGADVTIRAANGLTPLDEVRIFHYRDFDDIINMLQVAEKSMKKYIMRTDDAKISTPIQEILNDNKDNNVESYCKTSRNETEHLWIQTYESIYLKIMINLFNRVNMTDIGDLLLSVINSMFISNTPRIYLQLSQDTSRLDDIKKIHQIYCRMCTKLFNVFDLHFNQSIDVSFPPNAKLCEDAELVLSVEIHPELEWVALKLFADPSGTTDSRYSMEYYILCVANSRSHCILCRKYKADLRVNSANLLEEYTKYFSLEQQNRIRKYRSPQFYLQIYV